MRLAVHVGRLIADVFHFSIARRHLALLAVIILALVVVAIAVASQAAAPFALYPFV